MILQYVSNTSIQYFVWVLQHTLNLWSVKDEQQKTSQFLAKNTKSVIFPALNWPYLGLEIHLIWFIFCRKLTKADSLWVFDNSNIDRPQGTLFSTNDITYLKFQLVCCPVIGWKKCRRSNFCHAGVRFYTYYQHYAVSINVVSANMFLILSKVGSFALVG